MTISTTVNDGNNQNTSSQLGKHILVVGATGRTGSQIVTHLLSHHSRPQVHAFCRNIPEDNWIKRCASVQVGDARKTIDLVRALKNTQASAVIVAIGEGDSVRKTNIRTANAEALRRAIDITSNLPPEIQVVLVSSIGAGPSKIKVGMGIGKLIEYHLRHVLKDHTGQESVFLKDKYLAERTWVVRATGLTDKKGSGRVVEFGDLDKCPSTQIARSDVASYIVNKICDDSMSRLSGAVNIDTAKGTTSNSEVAVQ